MGMGLDQIWKFFRRRRRRRRRRPPAGMALKELKYQKNKILRKSQNQVTFFMKIKNYRGNYQSDIKKIEISKIEIWDSGYHGCVRLQKLVLKK